MKGLDILAGLVIMIIAAGAAGYYILNSMPSSPFYNEQLTTTESSIAAADPSKEGYAPYPDLPLEAYEEPVSIKYLVEHRSALNNEVVVVRGVVVGVLTQEEACPPGVGFCAQPSIFLADTLDDDRDRYLDMRILLDEYNKDYSENDVGKTIELSVIVEGSRTSLTLVKVY